MSAPYYEDAPLTLHLGDCRAVMAEMPEASVDAIVTDPPYDLTAGKKGGSGDASVNLNSPAGRARITAGFMGKRWDGTGVAFDVATWAAAFRVLKPGGHILAFGGPRTYHRMATAIEDAGFEIRDCLMWLFGSGFPKSLNVSKAIDRANGDEREVLGTEPDRWTGKGGVLNFATDRPQDEVQILGSAASAASAAREGWGTALKPAYEPIVLARKPLIGTVAANVAAYGVGGLNIDACRIGVNAGWSYPNGRGGEGWQGRESLSRNLDQPMEAASGRWPANVLLDEEAARLLDAQAPATGASSVELAANYDQRNEVLGAFAGHAPFGHDDLGGASRFFYTAKTSRAEREFGLDDLEPARRSDGRDKDIENPRLRTNQRRNDHPTVKPVDLMRWLCRLVTPPGGLVLDPFLGSGSTGMAALDEGFRFMGVDLEKRYLEIARRRITRRHNIEPMPQSTDGQAVLL